MIEFFCKEITELQGLDFFWFFICIFIGGFVGMGIAYGLIWRLWK